MNIHPVTGKVCHGLGGGQASIDNVAFGKGGVGGWISDTEVLFANGDDNWAVSAYHIGTKTSRRLMNISANTLFADGGGYWATWLSGNGISTSYGFAVPNGGLLGMGYNGTLAYKPQQQSSGPTVGYRPGDGQFPICDGHATDPQVVGHQKVIWTENDNVVKSVGGLPPCGTVGGLLWKARAAFAGGEWWVCYYSDKAGIVLHPFGSFAGFSILPSGDGWHSIAAISADTIRVIVSTHEGEQPGDLWGYDLNVVTKAITPWGPSIAAPFTPVYVADCRLINVDAHPMGPLSPAEPEGTIVDLGAAFFGDPTPHPRSGPSHAMNQVRDGSKVHMVKFGNPDAYETWELDSWGIHALEDRSNPPISQHWTDTRFFPRAMKVGIAHAFTTPRHEAVWRDSHCTVTSRNPFIERVWVEASYAHYWCGPDRQDRPVKVVCYDPSDGVHEWDDATNTGRGVELYFADGTWSWWELHRSDRVFAAGNMNPVFNDQTLVQRSSFYLYGGENTQPKLSGCATVISVLPYPLAVTITEYPRVGRAPLTVPVKYEVTHAVAPVTTHLMINGSVAASSPALSGTLTTTLTAPGLYDLACISVDAVSTAKTGKIRTITVERSPSMTLPTAVLVTIHRFALAFPPPHGPAGQAHEDRCRVWIRALAEYVKYYHGASYGTKSAGTGRPQTKDVLAYQSATLFGGWDILSGAGTGNPTVNADPQWMDLTGQVFIPVTANDWLALSGRPALPFIVGQSAFDLGARLQRNDLTWLNSYGTCPVLRVMVSRQSSPLPLRRTLAEGRTQLTLVLRTLAARHQQAYVTLLSDTLHYTRQEMLDHVNACNAIMLAYPDQVVAAELGNEIGHSTQSPDLMDLDFLTTLDNLVSLRFPLAWGGAFAGGSFIDIHPDRAATAAGNGVMMQDLQIALKRPVLNGEPLGIAEIDGTVSGKQRTNNPRYAEQMAVVCRQRKLGGVVLHTESGLTCDAALAGAVETEAKRLFLAEMGTSIPPTGHPILDAALSPAYPTGYAFFIANWEAVVTEAKAWYARSQGHAPSSSDVGHGLWRGLNEGDRWLTLRVAWENCWPGGGPK